MVESPFPELIDNKGINYAYFFVFLVKLHFSKKIYLFQVLLWVSTVPADSPPGEWSPGPGGCTAHLLGDRPQHQA